MIQCRMNSHFRALADSYLFSSIRNKVDTYKAAHPDKRIVSLGIGDVTQPLAPIVVDAMAQAVYELGVKETFRGYPPEYGYDFLRDAVCAHYALYGVPLARAEVFCGDGAKSDLGNLTDIFGDNEVLIPDPVYPAYVDANVMAGRHITYISGENGALPTPDDLPHGSGFVVYLCSPNNPTGAAYTRDELAAWVDYACRTGSLILYDAAYEAFITTDAPHSIFEIPGSRECAIEIGSFSKCAGFTGVRCGWVVIPRELTADGTSVGALWARRQAAKFNGISYPVQRAAEAAFSADGWAACQANIAYYRQNAAAIASLLTEKGVSYTGGVDAPYIWLHCPDNMASWDFFSYLLENAQVVGTPGVGFGEKGEHHFRLTAFGSHEDTAKAIERLRRVL